MNDELAVVLREARPYRRSLMLASGLMVLQSASALVLPWLGGQLIAALVPSGRGPLLSTDGVFAAMAGLLAFQACLAVTHGYVLARTGDRLTADLRVRVYNHVQSLPLAFHHERSKGDLLTLLTQDVGILSAFISGTLVTLLPSVLTFAGALAMMMWIDWRLGAVAGLTVPVFFLLLQFMGRVIRPLSDELSAAHAHAFAIAEENLGLLPIIKAFTREGEISALYQRAVRRIRDLSTRQALARLGLGPAVELIATLGVLALIWIATREVLSGRLAPAALVTFLMYGLLLTRPMSALASVYGETHHVRAVTARLLGVLQIAPESGRTERSLPPVRGAVTFENVSFRYPGREPTFENLNLTISPGEIVALTGPNGAGKSTLASLLMRFVTPERGRILIDGIDVSTVSLGSLREQIALVPQYMLLQSGTVRDNIAAGRPDALPGAIETAARAACAHDFIAGLPAGYDTVVGEKGVRLSGGQQQRIALARALLKNAPILILDEATAMFDLEGEEEFQAFLKHRLRDRTVIVISHGTASLKLADRVVRLEAGGSIASTFRRLEEARVDPDRTTTGSAPRT
jgi:ABC-type multidrug transport system fused ATPase/permease subunit